MKITRKGVLYSTLPVLVLILVLTGLYWTQVRQLYHTVRMFDEDVIVANFSDMQSMIPTVAIKRSGKCNFWRCGHRWAYSRFRQGSQRLCACPERQWL